MRDNPQNLPQINLSPSREQPSASIVVVSYNTAAHIEGCLLSLLELEYPEVEIIVVDNASTDGSPELIRKRFPSVEVVEMADNRGFAGGSSVGLYMARGDIVAAVNPDVRLRSDWLSVMAATLLAHGDVGIVGSKILYPDGETIQHAGGMVHYPLATTEHIGRGERDTGQHDKPQYVSFVTGAALAMWREVGHTLRFFDEAFYPVYYEDVDLCWRANEEGLRTLYQPQAIAFHKESVTLDHKGGRYFSYYHANRLRFVVRHYTPEQVMLDFLPAEAARVVGDMPAEDRRASLNLLDNHMTDDSESESGEGSLEATALARKWSELGRHTGEVMSGWHIYERAHGRAQRKGEAKTLQTRLNNLFSRLYLWPTVRKQIDYNASLARTLRETSAQLADLQARIALQSMLSAGLVSKQEVSTGQLSSELEALRARIERLEGGRSGSTGMLD